MAALAYLVIGNSLVAMTLLMAMIRAGEVSRVSSLFYLVPPVARTHGLAIARRTHVAACMGRHGCGRGWGWIASRRTAMR